MQRPDMILFDYGGTLLSEPAYDELAAQKAVFPYLTANPRGLSAEEIRVEMQRLFGEFLRHKGEWTELHEWQLLRLCYESLGLRFSLSWAEMEELEWDAASPGEPIPHTEALLDFLNGAGIRSGVVSNISWSGAALKRRIDRLLPNNRFEFVLASSEYGVRKPNPLLFRVALARAGLEPERVWFCGDTFSADIRGARASGLFPVLYAPNVDAPEADFEFLCVRDWEDLIEALRAL